VPFACEASKPAWRRSGTGEATTPASGAEANLRFHNYPTWRDSLPFYEYYHGETGEGLGASHGWMALAGAGCALARSPRVVKLSTLRIFTNLDVLAA
jgi:hypothetical protein